MKRRELPVIGAALLMLAASIGSAQLPPPEPSVAPPGFFKSTCAQCHDISVVTSQRHTPAQWGELVDKMTDLGLMTDEANLARIKSYLAETYPSIESAPKK